MTKSDQSELSILTTAITQVGSYFFAIRKIIKENYRETQINRIGYFLRFTMPNSFTFAVPTSISR